MKITRDPNEKLKKDDIIDIIKEYHNSKEYKMLKKYSMYYDVENREIIERFLDKKRRSKKPNNLVPTSYFATVVDSMAGYMFNNVDYLSDDKTTQENFNLIIKNNNVDVKDMITGVRALAMNKAIELVYTIGDENYIDFKYATINPENVIIIYDDTIEPVVFAGIWVRKHENKKYDYKVDIIYKDEWQYYNLKGSDLEERKKPRTLYFNENPICVYQTDILTYKSPFAKIIQYIDALDVIITGNSNEIDRLVDAILVLGKTVKDEDKLNMDEWKILEGMQKEDRAEYLTKDMSPSFREYITKLLIQEIHKHSHVIDWYSPDSGLSGAVSAKALQTRLFDMNMYSQRIEKIFKDGAEKRNRLILQLMSAKGLGNGEIEIKYNRTLPSDFEDKINALKGVDFLSQQTKVEKVGLDWNIEKKRIDEEKDEVEIIDDIEQNSNKVPEEADTLEQNS